MTIRPETGIDGLRAELQLMKGQIAALQAQLRTVKPPTTNMASRALTPTLIGTATADVEAVNVTANPTPPPVAWGAVSSPYEMGIDGPRLQLPTDGFYMLRLAGTPNYTRHHDLAAYLGSFVSLDTPNCNLAGGTLATFDATSLASIYTAASTGMVLGVGNNVAFHGLSVYAAVHEGDQIPADTTLTFTVYRLQEG